MRIEGRQVEKLTVDMFKPGNEIFLVGKKVRGLRQHGQICNIRTGTSTIIFDYYCWHPRFQGGYFDLSFPERLPLERQLTRRRSFLIFQDEGLVWKRRHIAQFRLKEAKHEAGKI